MDGSGVGLPDRGEGKHKDTWILIERGYGVGGLFGMCIEEIKV